MRNKDYSKKIKKINDKFFIYERLKEKEFVMKLQQNTKSNILEYYTNSIILSIKDLKKEDRVLFEKKIKEKGLLENIKSRNIKQIVKKILNP